MWMANAQVVLNGAAGPILAVANLLPSEATQLHAIDGYSLAAYATAKKIVIISVQQTIKAMFQIPRPAEAAREGALPYLAWREVVYRESPKDGKRKAVDPVRFFFMAPAAKTRSDLWLRQNKILAVGWGTVVKLYTVVVSRAKFRPNDLDFMLVAEIPTSDELTGLVWITPSVMAIQNVKDELRILDPFALEEIEICPIAHVESVYHTKFDQVVDQLQVADGANVHFFSYHSSMRLHKNRLYLLGLRAIFSAHLLTWEERISALVDKSKWVEALALALDFYQGRGRAVEGLPKGPRTVQYSLSFPCSPRRSVTGSQI